MANPGLIRQTTLEAATEGVQVITKAFERSIMEDAGQLGWFVDVTNDTFSFMQTDRDFKGFLFGAGGADTWDMGLKRLSTELYAFRNYPADDDYTDFRVRELQASRIPHANVVAWGAAGDGATDDRSAISDALSELKTAGGGELFFPPGTFRMSTGISDSDLKGITIRGSGITTSTLKLDDVAARHFAFTASEGITFRDLTFQGAGSTTASNVGGGINMPLGSKSFNEGHRFENLQFLSMSETAIEVPTSRGLVISNVKIEDNALDMVDLTSPFTAHIESLLMVNGQQRGLYIHGGGKDVGVYASRAFQCGIGYEVDAAAVVFSGCTAEDGQNRSASFPGYGFVAGDTNSLVTLLNTCVISTAGITPYVENTGSEFAKFNARNVMAGVTVTESNAGGASAFSSEIDAQAGIDISGGALKIAGSTVIDASENADFGGTLAVGGNTSFGGDASFGNTVAIRFKDAGGSLRNVLTVGADDDVVIGGTSLDDIRFNIANRADHVVFTTVGVGINQSSPGAELHVVSQAAGRVGLIVDTAASPSANCAQFQINGTTRWSMDYRDSTGQMLQLATYDIGINTGRRIWIGENSNSTTPAAGHVIFRDLNSVSNYVWVDGSGDIRTGGTAPVFAQDASGIVVGTQTSWHKAKYNINDWDGAGALQRIIDTDLHSFQFKDCGQRGDKLMHGFVIHDRDAWYAMNTAHNQTPVLDVPEVLGTLTAAVKHLAADVAELKREVG